MSGGFEVDLDDLRGAAARCTRLAGDVASCHATNEVDYGSMTLSAAARSFRDRWGHGLDDLRDDLRDAANRLTKTADAYELADEQAAERICKSVP